MFILLCNNVDNDPHSRGKWDSSPTKEQLVNVLKHYHKDADMLAYKLICSGSCCVNDSSCTTYELQSI